MTLSYFESILHLVENSSPEQLDPRWIEELKLYGDHLVYSCHMVNTEAVYGNKSAMHDYMGIANSILRVLEVLSKCQGVSGYRSEIEKTPCKKCISAMFKVLYNFIDSYEDDEQTQEIKRLEKELKVRLGLEIPQPKGERIPIE